MSGLVVSQLELDECDSIRGAWNHMITDRSSTIGDIDLTESFEWVQTLWDVHLRRNKGTVLVLKKGEEIIAVLPLYRFAKTMRSLPVRAIAPISRLYSNRPGFLLRENSAEVMAALLDSLTDEVGGWDVFEFGLVDGSDSERLFLECARSRGWSFQKTPALESPYIEFPEDWASFVSSLPKKFRWLLKKSQSLMDEAGTTGYRHIGSSDDLERFYEAVIEIERESWKEEAGTSLTQNPLQDEFHRELLHPAAANGWFNGHLLELNKEPVAYIYGLSTGRIYSDLKESYKQKYRDLSPGHVLKVHAFQRLINDGVNLYDFSGLCEPYKLKWTSKTYSQSTYQVFNRTVRGRLANVAFAITRRPPSTST